MRLTRQQVKYGVAFFVSGCLLTVVFNSCIGNCIAVMRQDKLSALIYQIQGKCCLYTTKSTSDPNTYCQKKFDPFVPRFKYKCVSDAALCLGGMGKDASKAVPALIEALETGPNNYNTGDGTIPTRNDIMYALGATGDPRAVKPLIAALYSPRLEDTHRYGFQRPQPLGQDAAMYALGSLGSTAKEAVPHIIPFLKGSSPHIFRAATTALGQIKDPRAIPALTEALDHPARAASAAQALREFGPQADAAVPVLLERLKQWPDEYASNMIADAIRKIRGEAAVPRITYWHKLTDFSQYLRTILDEYKLGGVFTYDYTEGERYSQTLPTGETLYIRLDRTRGKSSLTSGQVSIEKNDKKVSEQRFTTFEEMRLLVKKMLDNRLKTPRR